MRHPNMRLLEAALASLVLIAGMSLAFAAPVPPSPVQIDIVATGPSLSYTSDMIQASIQKSAGMMNMDDWTPVGKSQLADKTYSLSFTGMTTFTFEVIRGIYTPLMVNYLVGPSDDANPVLAVSVAVSLRGQYGISYTQAATSSGSSSSPPPSPPPPPPPSPPPPPPPSPPPPPPPSPPPPKVVTSDQWSNVLAVIRIAGIPKTTFNIYIAGALNVLFFNQWGQNSATAFVRCLPLPTDIYTQSYQANFTIGPLPSSTFDRVLPTLTVPTMNTILRDTVTSMYPKNTPLIPILLDITILQN